MWVFIQTVLSINPIQGLSEKYVETLDDKLVIYIQYAIEQGWRIIVVLLVGMM